MTDMLTLPVRHKSGQYNLIVGQDVLQQAGACLTDIQATGPLGIITNSRVNALYGDILRDSLQASGYATRTILIPDGEQYKTLASAEQVLQALITQGMERTGTIITLGGGVVTDLGGFVASILYRGIRVIHIPTTLLAMVDAAVGGKTGVNHSQGKNLIGSFYQPDLVLMDVNTLVTLDTRDRVSGFAEMLKMGAILDSKYLETLIEHQSQFLTRADPGMPANLIRRCCELKAGIVAEDELEQDRRRILNFGHTLGHAIENLLGYGRIRHGEAVILGMYGAAWLSRQVGELSEGNWQTFAGFLRGIPLQVDFKALDGDELVKRIQLDKKVADGRLYFVLISELGKASLGSNLPTLMIKLAVDAINKEWSTQK